MTGDNERQEILNDDLVLYAATEHLQLSPALSPAVHAVPALIPSGSGRKNRSGTTTPVAPTSATRRTSSSRVHYQASSDQAQTRRSGSNGNVHNNSNTMSKHTTSSAGEGSSSSPPSSSATSSPTKTATDDDRIEEDIEGLLLPPPIGAAGLDKKTALNGFDYAYPYGIRAGAAVVIPKSSPSAKTQPNRTNANATATSTTTSTGMRKSISQQHNRHSKPQNLMLSPVFAPKSMGATATTTTILDPSSTSRPSTSSSISNTTHDNSNTPPLNPSEVITFRRRHYAPDSINGHQKSSHGSSNVSATTSSSASPAFQAQNIPSTTAAKSSSSSRRHSSHGSAITSPKMVPAFSPLVKARSTTSRSIPTLKDTSDGAPSTSTSTSSPLMKPVDAGQSVTPSPSLAASSLSDLLLRTVSRSESITGQQQQYQQSSSSSSIAGNKRASKSDTVLVDSIPEYGIVSSTLSKNGNGNNKPSWLQRNKLIKNLFPVNNGPSSTLPRIGAEASNGSNHSSTHTTCGRKNCPVNHSHTSSSTNPSLHPLATFYSPLGRRVSEPGGSVSPFASPAIYYADPPLDPFEESFVNTTTSRSVSDSITATFKNKSLSPTSPVGDSSRNGIDSVSTRRRPSLSTSMTAPPAVITSPSPGVGSIKAQDYSGFAGFLFALHNQRKANAAAAAAQASGSNGPVTSSSNPSVTGGKDIKRASFDIYTTPESSESGYDAQDGRLPANRGRGRNISRRAVEKYPYESSGTLFKSEENSTIGAHTAKPALLEEKLLNVKASIERPSSSSSTEAPGHLNAPSAENTADVSPARFNASSNGRPTRFMFGRGNAFKNSNLDDSTDKNDVAAVDSKEELNHDQAQQRSKSNVTASGPPRLRLRHNHSTSVGEGSQYIVNLRGQATKGSKERDGEEDDSLSKELNLTDEEDSLSPSPERGLPVTQREQETRGRPTDRRRSSAIGRMPVVSPFTTLERGTVQKSKYDDEAAAAVDDGGGRGRSRARGSAALHRSVSPARSSSRARGRDSPRLRTR